MGLKEKMAKKYLKKMGYDFNDPKICTLRVISNLIETSILRYITKKEMIEFLENHIKKLEKNV